MSLDAERRSRLLLALGLEAHHSHAVALAPHARLAAHARQLARVRAGSRARRCVKRLKDATSRTLRDFGAMQGSLWGPAEVRSGL
jgi:hypothetical protein